MTEFSPDVREYYEKDKEAARLNAGHGQLEFVRTQEIIRRYLPSPPLRILDVGGAAGVHAAWLADDGHIVYLIDPMPNHVEAARRLGNSARRITADIGDARDLDVDDDSVMPSCCSDRSITSPNASTAYERCKKRGVSCGTADTCSSPRSLGLRRCSTV